MQGAKRGQSRWEALKLVCDWERMVGQRPKGNQSGENGSFNDKKLDLDYSTSRQANNLNSALPTPAEYQIVSYHLLPY